MATRARSRKGSGKRSARARILAILSREKNAFNRKTQEYERRAPTLKETAKLLRVSVSTLRRWKEGKAPAAKTRRQKAAVRRLEKISSAAERATKREQARDRRQHPEALRLDKRKLPTLPTGYRRKLKRYAVDQKGRVRPTGEEYDSSIVNYNVQGWTFREIAGLVLQAWRAKKPFQFVYEVPAGGSLPRSGRSKERKVRKATRAGTAPIDPLGLETESEVLTVLNRYIDFEDGIYSRKMMYVAVDDNYAGPEDDEE